MALKLAAGDFKTPVKLLQPSKVVNDEGGTEIGHSEAFTTMAAERKIDQRRVLESGGTQVLDTRLMYLRYSPKTAPVNKDWLIEIGGEKYLIHGKPLIIDSGLKVLEVVAKATHNG